jgi:SnoaL-like protein
MTGTTGQVTTAESDPAAAGDDVSTVTQVVLHERQGRDRAWWDQMLRAYWPDSTVRLSWYDGDGPGFVAGSKALTEAGLTTRHSMYAPVVHVRGTRAYVEAPTAVRAPLVVDGVRGDLVSYTRLNYRLERRGRDWRISSLDPIYEDTTLTPSIPGQRIDIPAEELARFRPSYAILAWDLARNERAMSEGLLGDDQPEPVASFYATTWEWLNG